MSVKRINKFMNSEELDPNNVQHDQNERKYIFLKNFFIYLFAVKHRYLINKFFAAYPLIIDNGSFSWDSEENDKPVLRNINLKIEESQLAAIVGTVGSGKSSLISAFLGEMNKLSGRVNTKASFIILKIH